MQPSLSLLRPEMRSGLSFNDGTPDRIRRSRQATCWPRLLHPPTAVHLPGSRPPQLLTKGTKSNVSPRKVASIKMECASPFQPDRERLHYWLTASLWRSCAGDSNKIRTALSSSALMSTPESAMRRAHSAPESSSPCLTTYPQHPKTPLRSLTISGYLGPQSKRIDSHPNAEPGQCLDSLLALWFGGVGRRQNCKQTLRVYQYDYGFIRAQHVAAVQLLTGGAKVNQKLTLQ